MKTQYTNVIHRDYQLSLLSCFVHDDPSLSPPNLIIHGCKFSGKTHTVGQWFKIQPEILCCSINAVQMVTGKPFAQHVAVQISKLLKETFPGVAKKDFDPLSAEDFSLLAKFLHNIFCQYEELERSHSLFVILDNFDKIDELDVELLPKFLKLYELLPRSFKLQIKFIYIIQETSFLNQYPTYNIPTILFPRYTQEQTSEIVHLARDSELSGYPPLLSKIASYGENNTLVNRRCFEISHNFVNLIIQAFHSYSGNNPVLLMELADCKWESYVDSITEANYKDSLALYRLNVELFRNTGDTFLDQEDDEDEDVSNGGGDDIDDENDTNVTETNGSYDNENRTVQSSVIPSNKPQTKTTAYGLSAMSKYLLIAAYLTSYLNPRFDSKVFSKKSHLRAGRSSYGRRNKMATNPRYLQPSLFSLERMLAIFQSIYPAQISKELHPDFIQKDTHMRANVEVYENLAELNSLKLITSAINKSVDYLHEKIKWKVNIPWEIIIEVARTVDFDIAEYFSDIHD
ncbi:origin recognition complex subunit 5 Ecym_1100 [Eremothecium cymbalariae DBVPG|uniref:Orc1-like AAA ATPase domain-containing protein n=1 Tax=Eremothecium cymbalariae (strain CBS 270.75 / DBVPG 7215 / KCTC 17166 / NRRL Y-17582) TaxID=931890 RepID=G8JME7_ERECY|nr:hypothetical protein Ecym_1100 [Eremothecium cymbalariae DBVPG\